MPTTPWQIDNRTASLRTVGLAAEVSLAQTTFGLCQIVAGGNRWRSAQLLGLTTTAAPTSAEERSHRACSPPELPEREMHAGEAESARAPIENYVRGDDLMLAYETPQGRPMHVDALWRVVRPQPGERFLVAVELIVSVRTQQRDAWPELAVESTLPVCETLRLDDAKPIRCRPLSPALEATFTLGSEEGAGCLLCRQTGFPLSYVEMVHPTDFCHDQWRPKTPAGDGSRLSHRLFHAALEKGVLLRGRVRGVFVPRVDDTRLAAECYAAFAAADPPLGT